MYGCNKKYLFYVVILLTFSFIAYNLFLTDNLAKEKISKYFLVNFSSVRNNSLTGSTSIVIETLDVVPFVNGSTPGVIDSDVIDSTNLSILFTSPTSLDFMSSHVPASNENDFTTKSPDPTCGYFVRSLWDGRLGSQMFVYASFFGMVKKHQSANKTSFILVDQLPSSLDHVFPNLSISQKIVPDSWFESKNFKARGEGGCCSYYRNGLEQLQCDGQNVIVHGYRQCYRYFDQVPEEVKKEFTFEKSIRKASRRLIDDSLIEKGLNRKNCVTVGVHLRRGDFALDEKRSFGHWPAHVDYLKKAIRYHEILHSENETKFDFCLAFLIFGDDGEWNLNATKQVELLRPNATYLILIDSAKSMAEIDMCALAMCDHVSFSTGTFGWWSAFLNRGVVTYQKEFARFNSAHYSEYEPKEWFLPQWIPL